MYVGMRGLANWFFYFFFLSSSRCFIIIIEMVYVGYVDECGLLDDKVDNSIDLECWLDPTEDEFFLFEK